jgi:predicted AlkP superfamily pyrophosphatase or phosphodiesterase
MFSSIRSAVTNLALIAFILAAGAIAHAAERVILISVDGLRPDAVSTLGEEVLPNFYRLRHEGAFTDNARADYDITVTLPNHTCMITGRRVQGHEGHNWLENATPTQTLHDNKGAYLASMFDVAHDAGLATALFASKDKFHLYDDSYDAHNGADNTHGKDKIDIYKQANSGAEALATAEPVVDMLIADLAEHPCHLVMLHILDPDSAGHHDGWMNDSYLAAVKRADTMLGRVMAFIETNPNYAGKTTVILTSDHGGSQKSHSNAEIPENYTVPFYVWGADVTPGSDLYEINPDSRQNPGTTRPDYADAKQPIRNGDAGNLALSLLDLNAIPGSTINADRSLRTSITKQ